MTTSIIRPQGRWGAIAVALSSFFVLVAGFCGYFYACDNAWLSSVSRDLTKDAKTDDERVLSLLDWVHNGLGTHKNNKHFLFAQFGPTPVQIMREGGDCADKSRLLCAMLREIDIAATPVMCFDPQSGKPTHTIVEARIADGEYMVVDPAYGLFFPRNGKAGYHDLLDLRRDPSIVERRVDAISRQSPKMREEDRYYLRAYSGYQGVSTFNWNKGTMSGVLHDFLERRLGDDVYRLPRPATLERPKVLVAWSCLLAAILVQVVAVLVRGLIRRRVHPGVRGANSRVSTPKAYSAHPLPASFS